MPVTSGMKGGGFYDQHSSPQLASILAVLPWLEEAVGRFELPAAPNPIVVVDYGCSEGANSIAAARRIVAALRARTSRPIQTVHSDLPTNNFNQLFASLAAAGLPFSTAGHVYSAAVGGSLFERLMPPQTVSIVTTFNAIGFLNQRPSALIPDYILSTVPRRPRKGIAVSREAKEAYQHQAMEDLVCFYRARAEEIVPGGALLVASFGTSELHQTCDGLYEVLNDALLDQVASGRLKRATYEKLVFPIYFRTREELVAPVVGDDAPCARSFRVERVADLEIPVPFSQRLAESGDVPVYAGEFTSFLRAFTEPILRLSLDDQADLDNLIEDLYGRVRARLTADPADYEFHYTEVAALLTRL